MDRLMRLVPYGNKMLAFASNGVWEIGPGDLGFFSPISYSIRKITDIGTVAPLSVVSAEGVLHYWGNDGIYRMEEDTNTGYLTVVNISLPTINRLFLGIEPRAFQWIKAKYDDAEKRIMFFYDGLDTSSTELEGSIYFEKIGPTTPNTYGDVIPHTIRHALVFDLRKGGFYRMRFAQNKPIKDVFVLPSYLTNERKNKYKFLLDDLGTSRVI